MRPFRRPTRHEQPLAELALEGVVALAAGSPSAGGAGDGFGGRAGEWEVGAHYDLWAAEWGLILRRSSDPNRSVPDLLPWSSVTSVTAEAVAELPDGSSGQVLEVQAIDGGWLGGNPVQRFTAPAPAMGAFLLTASRWRQSALDAVPDGSEVVSDDEGGAAGVGALAGVRGSYPLGGAPERE